MAISSIGSASTTSSTTAKTPSAAAGDDKPKTAEELLASSAEKVKNNTGPQSAVHKLLAKNGEGTISNLSAVQKIFSEDAAKEKAKAEPYTEQDWFLSMRMNYLKNQIDFYSRLGGDIGNSMMDSIETEVRGILKTQQQKLKASQAEAEAKQKEVEASKDPFAGLPTAKDLLTKSLNKVNGVSDPQELSAAVQALLKNSSNAVDAARGTTVNKKA